MDKGTVFVISVMGVLAVIMAGIFSYSKTHQAEVFSFTVQESYFELTARNVSRVEIWALPTGTNSKENDALFLAGMNRVESGSIQVWQAAIPNDPLLVTTIFIRAYDSTNHIISERALPYTGATEIYNALWNIPRE